MHRSPVMVLPAAVVLLLVCCLPCQSATICVRWDSATNGPGNDWDHAYHTVSSGLNAAVSGDEVWVARGTYVECITLKAGVAVYGGFAGFETSRDERHPFPRPVPDTCQSILDGHRSGSVVQFQSGASETTRIDGFVVRNGWAQSGGGGLKCSSSSPMVANCVITENDSWSDGGGIYCSSSSATIVGCTLLANDAWWNGGGIALKNSNVRILNSRIVCNGATSGGGIYVSESSADISNNTIVGNDAAFGGALHVQDGSPSITANIISFNASGIRVASGSPNLKKNCVYGNSADDYSGLGPGTEDIQHDPQLAGVSFGNLHIQPTSPCRDAGEDTSAAIAWPDMDGQNRLRGAHIDIGADETDGAEWPTGPYVTVRVSPDGDDSNDGSTWALAKRSLQAAMDTAATRGGEVWVKKGVYTVNLQLKPFTYLYGGFDGSESVRTSRDWSDNITILDGDWSNSVITIRAGYMSSCVSGFIIRHGTARVNSGWSAGGGIRCERSSATIANNIVSANGSHGAPQGGFGGGIYCIGSSVIRGNCFFGNTSSKFGGAIYCAKDYSPKILNNTISGNSSENGGGIYLQDRCKALIINNVIAFNSSGISKTADSSPILNNNCVYGNSDYDYAGISAGVGDISADPDLVSREYGDLHISPASPCINSGLDSAVEPGFLDTDGQERQNGLHVDIGADESYGEVRLPSSVIVRVSPDGDDANDGSSWGAAKRSLRAAIDSASVCGGEVWVKSGVYPGYLILVPNVSVYGGFAGTETDRLQRDPDSNSTILDGQKQATVVYASNGYVEHALDGFSIQNSGSGYSAVLCGRSLCRITNNSIIGHSTAVRCEYSACTISDNAITRNDTGIYCMYGTPRIERNTISDVQFAGIECSNSAPIIYGNTITDANFRGIKCVSSSPVVRENRIFNNDGTGIELNASSAPTIVNNWILGNRGRGISCFDSNPVVASNAIVGNSGHSGAAIYCSSSSPRVVNNTIVGNNSLNGAVNCTSSSAVLSNNIVAFNASGIYASGGSPTLSCNCVYGNNRNDYWGVSPGTGDISADPRLANWPYGILHIQQDSPCVDAGKHEWLQVGWMDLDGHSRVTGTHVDIGAYESTGEAWTDEPRIVRVSPTGNDSNDGTGWDDESAKRTLQGAIDSAVGAGAEIWVKSGYYPERITVGPFVHLYGGFSGGEAQKSQRDWLHNESKLDGQQLGSVITMRYGGYRCNTIDGLTITNGRVLSSSSGLDRAGGICYLNSSPIISNNKISANLGTRGAAIYGSGSMAIIQSNTIADNSSGVYLLGNATDVICHNVMERNGDAAIRCDESGPTILNNVIAESGSYGIMNSFPSSTVTITGNTIVRNPRGVSQSSGTPLISNNIVAYNHRGIDVGQATLHSNCVYGNTLWNYVPGRTPGVGDISSDPLFRNKDAGDYHLSALSPCINAGWNEAVGMPQSDFDGQPRIAGGTVDIGADELWWSVPELKLSPDDRRVGRSAAIVSAVFGDSFYIEADDRSSGIRVDSPGHALEEGMRADIEGLIKTDDTTGERYISSSSLPNQNGFGSVDPVQLSNRVLGGGDFQYDPLTHTGQRGVESGSGLNNIGLLVQIVGRVTEVGTDFFCVHDGSRVCDTFQANAVRVICGASSKPDTGSYVAVVGISSITRVDDHYFRAVKLCSYAVVQAAQ